MGIEFAGAAKARELREYFSRHGRIYIVVNATLDDVRIPEYLHGDPALRLVLNVRMPQQILIRDEALESDFVFSGEPYHCVIPMQAIWAAYVPEHQLENGMLWEDDVPETIRAVVKAVRSMRDEPETRAEIENRRSAGGQPKDADTQSDTEQQSCKQGTVRRRGHLRVVK